MAYFVEEQPGGPALIGRRPTINELFMSVYHLQPYAGCEFGCGYCDGWSYSLRPFNEAVRVFTDLPERLDAQLPEVSTGDLIALNLADPYQPAEQSYRLTRQILRRFAERGQPCLIMTKSLSVLEDLPYLRQINERSLAVVMTSLITTDMRISSQMEGRAPAPQARLEMLAELKRAGIPTAVAMVPVVPYLTDTERQLQALLEAIASAGPDFVVWEYLLQPNSRHVERMAALLGKLGNYPTSYYRDLYGENPDPSDDYRRTMDREILGRCEALGLEPRPPLALYRDKLDRRSVAALMFKGQAFLDSVKGRAVLAERHRRLAEEVFQGTAIAAELAGSPLWPTVRDVLDLRGQSVG